MAESFFTLKLECFYDCQFKTRSEVGKGIFEYIEAWYNQKKSHSVFGWLLFCEYVMKKQKLVVQLNRLSIFLLQVRYGKNL